MGIGLALITKALMAKKALPKVMEVFACKGCNSLGAVKVFTNRIEVVRCKCNGH